MRLRFEWDDEKAGSNLAKHRVGFEEASTVFRDELSLTIYDREHSTEEDRFVTCNDGHVCVWQAARGRPH
jgi:uncharacterized DUF497 family protein